MSKLEFYEYLLKLESQAASLLDSLSLLSDGKNSRIEHARRRAFARWSKRYDARRIHEEFFSNADKLQLHSGDSVRLPVSASELAFSAGAFVLSMEPCQAGEGAKERAEPAEAGQWGNQTPKQKHKKTYKNGCPGCGDIGFNRDTICRTCGYMVPKIIKQQCKNHSVNELFCCCDDCTSSFIPPLYSVEYLECVS